MLLSRLLRTIRSRAFSFHAMSDLFLPRHTANHLHNCITKIKLSFILDCERSCFLCVDQSRSKVNVAYGIDRVLTVNGTDTDLNWNTGYYFTTITNVRLDYLVQK